MARETNKPNIKIKQNNGNNGNEFNKSVCSPLSTNSGYTCMTSKHLKELSKLWNKRYPDYQITTESSREIWLFFKKVFSSSCDNERCWLKNKMFGSGISDDLLNELNDLYAPKAPESWKTNPITWLNSMDIISVMQQYERRYSCFRFIGPSPIDFDRLLMSFNGNKECVWNELCNFNINSQGDKSKIGIIFNTDPHNKPGEHWVSLFIDKAQHNIVYFDSAGSNIPIQIKRFVERIQKQLKNSKKETYTFIINNIIHQKKNTECGMYSLYFIIQMLKTGNYLKFTNSKNTITDQMMENLREEYFNIN